MRGRIPDIFVPFVASLLLPGAGQLVLGRVWTGIALFIAFVAVNALSAHQLLSPLSKVSEHYYWGFAAGLLVYVFGIGHAGVVAGRANAEGKAGWRPSGIQRAALALIAVLVLGFYAVSLRSLAARHLRVFVSPADAMEPTIYKDDKLLVKTISARDKLARGDIIIYRAPLEPDKVFIHRIVAFAGESVELKDHRIRINGSELKEPWALKVRHYNGGQYAKKGMKPVVVPEAMYYVLGDNAVHSQDSRIWGFLPEKNVIGKVYKRYYPFDRSGPID